MQVDRRTATAFGSLAAVIVLALVAWLTSSGDDSTDRSTTSSSASPSVSSSASGPETSRASTDPDSGLPVVSADDLPGEARETLALIDAGGPFPYPDRDGVVFGNYEGLLPQQSRGYYHEYTVPTPGESDRGARRIITGSDDELYWTADHYDSFERIDRS